MDLPPQTPPRANHLPAKRALAAAAIALLGAVGLVVIGGPLLVLQAVAHTTVEAAAATVLFVDVRGISFPAAGDAVVSYGDDQLFLRDLVIVSAAWAGAAALGTTALAGALVASRPGTWLLVAAATVFAARVLWVSPNPLATHEVVITQPAQRVTWWAFVAIAAALGAVGATQHELSCRAALALVGTVQLSGTLAAARALGGTPHSGRDSAQRLHDVLPFFDVHAAAWVIRATAVATGVGVTFAWARRARGRLRLTPRPSPHRAAVAALTAAVVLGAATPGPADRLADLPSPASPPPSDGQARPGG